VAADRGWLPREILSPAVGRNGHASFHVAVTVPPGENYQLFVAMNPTDACRATLYRERFVQEAEGWIPDYLVGLPRTQDGGAIPDPEQKIEGQTTRVYLLDVWIPPDAPLRRFRLEMQLKTADWTIRPMEFRVMEARYPDVSLSGRPPALAPAAQGADATAFSALRDTGAGVDRLPGTIRDIIHRNAMQDAALARARNENPLRTAFDLLRTNVLFQPRPWGAEWYLKIRDALLR
jgi:hypothetical protein